MDIIIIPVLLLIKSIIALASGIVIADVLLSWLIAMNIFNTSNKFVFSIIDGISRISGFMLNPIRRKIPISIGSFDISPIILLLLLTFIDNIIQRILVRF